MVQVVEEVLGENHGSGLTHKSHWDSCAHSHASRETRADTHIHMHTHPKAGTRKRQPLTGRPHPSQTDQPSPASFTWRHAVLKEHPLPPAHPSRDIYLPTVFQMPMASPQTLLLCLLVLAVTEGQGQQAAIPGCYLHRK